MTPFAPGPARGREPSPARPPFGPPFGPGVLIGGAVAAIIIVFLLIGVFTEPPPEERQAPGTQATSERSQATTSPATEAKTREEKPKPERVELVLEPDGPTYVCVDDGRGTIVFEDTIDGRERFSGKLLRINMGLAAGNIEVNGEPVKIEEGPNPVGFSFEPGKTRELADGDRPCQ